MQEQRVDMASLPCRRSCDHATSFAVLAGALAVVEALTVVACAARLPIPVPAVVHFAGYSFLHHT